jgi:hypothetical protein
LEMSQPGTVMDKESQAALFPVRALIHPGSLAQRQHSWDQGSEHDPAQSGT